MEQSNMSNINDLFLQASKCKLRIQTSKWQVTVEDLQDLPLTGAVSNGFNANLNAIALSLDKVLREAPSKSLADDKPTSVADTKLKLAFDIVLVIIAAKKDEVNKAAILRDKAAKRGKLLEILSKKEDQSLEASSTEDIKKMLEELGQ